MDTSAAFTVEQTERGTRAVLAGDWTAACLADAGLRLERALRADGEVAFDLNKVGRCDTAGAFAIIRAAHNRLDPAEVEAPEGVRRLLELVGAAAQTPRAEPRKGLTPVQFLERLGRGVVGIWHDFYGTMAFTGHLLVAAGRVIANPRRIRWTACISLAERAGFDAVPIVAVATFFIGAVVAFIGANELQLFGAQVFAVDLIGISILREFNIVITAVLLAGRSASSFAAEIGAMKMNQEIDAMQIMGVDPFEALVLPRFAALLVTIPLLTFVASVAGLVGGMLVAWSTLGISPQFFLERLTEDVTVSNFLVGLSKSPVMALVIAGIGCRQGLEVGGDVETLGRRVTSAVVHAIFSIILIDAVFALVYMELNV